MIQVIYTKDSSKSMSYEISSNISLMWLLNPDLQVIILLLSQGGQTFIFDESFTIHHPTLISVSYGKHLLPLGSNPEGAGSSHLSLELICGGVWRNCHQKDLQAGWLEAWICGIKARSHDYLTQVAISLLVGWLERKLLVLQPYGFLCLVSPHVIMLFGHDNHVFFLYYPTMCDLHI